MKDEFTRLHPLVNLIFYIVVLGITMFQMQIGLTLISVFSALVYFFYLKKSSGIRNLLAVIVIFLISSLINPMFSHRGSTVLFYLFTGNAVTLESVIYGMAASAVICAMLIWFFIFYQVMTMDRVLGVIGKVMPHIALLITMILRFIPKYARHQKEVSRMNAKRAGKSLKEKIKNGSKIFSITTTWALENSIYTADSMKARGFGVKKRTSYSNYRIDGQDIGILVWIIFLTGCVICMLYRETLYTYYYPYVVNKNNIPAYILYALLCFTPVLFNIREGIRWHRLKSKI